MNIEQLAIAELLKDPQNARAHSDKNVAAVKRSLVEFGQQKPIVITADNLVAAGNCTVVAAAELGWETIQAVRTDLKGKAVAAYAIADNRTAELSVWDDEVLSATLSALAADDPDLLAATGFDDSDLEDLTKGLAANTPPEDFPEVDENIETEHECPKCGYKWSGGGK